MWILPKNYPLSFHFVQDMVASKEDLTLPGLNIESSLMWRSKPMRLPSWLKKWKKGSYLLPLFTRILKPFHRKSFEEKLALSLGAIHVRALAQQETEKETKTPDICGHTYGDTLNQLDLFNASLKTCKAMSLLASFQSSANWNQCVIEQRGEYSQRVRLAHRTKEKGFLFYPTPSAHEARLGYQDRSDPKKKGTQQSLTTVVVNKAGGRKKCSGHLNPDWVEWLMGVPIGWTELGSWETELFHKQQQKHGSRSTKDSRH